jgi:dCTP deaminase
MSILTDDAILEEMEQGYIKISPFERMHLGTNSVDLTLDPKMLIYDLFDEPAPDDYPAPTLDCRRKNQATKEIIIPEWGFVLEPNKVYVASTVERTETLRHVPKLEGKSSLGRLGLFIHVTAGYGDVGFVGTWTLELVAVQPIRIYPNMKICQISYHTIVGTPRVLYGDKGDSKYNNQDGATASRYHKNFK